MLIENSRQKNIDPSHQLNLLKENTEKLIPKIYQDHALYLEILRQLLLETVKKAVFPLLTQSNNSSVNKYTSKSINKLQNTLSDLVFKSNSLLTIEHLMDLVREMEQTSIKDMKKSTEILLDSIKAEEQINEESEDSVELKLDLPIQGHKDIDKLFSKIGDENNLKENKNTIEDNISSNDTTKESSAAAKLNQEDSKKEETKTGIDVIKSLFALAGESIVKNNNFSSDANLGEGSLFAESTESVENSLMPNNPPDLYKWMDLFELALIRRLRNLSQSINVELLKFGIINSLLPVSLLDAVLLGEAEAVFLSSNLHKLQIPLSNSLVKTSMDVTFVLLRYSDIEFDNPHLRNCRSHLRQHRQTLIKMVKQHQYWHSRQLVQKVNQQWWQNPPETSPKTTPKS